MKIRLKIGCIICVAVVALATGGNASAQENQLSPSPPLQWPTDASSSATGFFFISSLRANVQLAANIVLCKTLLKHAKKTVPPDPFNYSVDCPPDYQSMIQARQGVVHWKEGAQPTVCGSSCVDALLMVQTLNLGTPNVRFGTVSGDLQFEAETGVGSRGITIYFHTDARCDIPTGLKAGELNLITVVEPPYVEGLGPGEAILSGFLDIFAVNLSGYITQQIEKDLGSQGSSTTTRGANLGPCSSIGVSNGDIPSFVWDLPKRTVNPAGSAAIKPMASLHFDHVTNMMPPDDPNIKYDAAAYSQVDGLCEWSFRAHSLSAQCEKPR